MHHPLSNTTFFIFALFSALAGSACDIVQGFRDASSALFPPERTYFDAPGYRLLEGGYRGLDFAMVTDLSVLVRSSDPADGSLYVMRYADPKPCAIPNVGEYRAGQGAYTTDTIIAYVERDDPDGILRFSNIDCGHYDLTIPGGKPPFQELAQGFILLANQVVMLVDPVGGLVKPLVANVEHVYPNALAGLHVLYVDGRLAVFKPDWTEVKRFGTEINGWGGLGTSFYFQDAEGVHRLRSAGGTPPVVTDELLSAGGCDMRFPPGLGGSDPWVTFRPGCRDDAITAFNETTGHASVVPYVPGTDRVALLPAWPNSSGDPDATPYWYFYVANVDDNGVGTLVMRTTDGQTHTIAERSAFDHLTVVGSPNTHGFALTDIDLNLDVPAGRYLRWHIDGSTEVLADSVKVGGGEVILNPSGNTGDFALPSMDGLQTIAKQVPYGYFHFQDDGKRWSAVLSDYHDQQATLSITSKSLDFASAARELSPTPVPDLTPIANNVAADGRAQFVISLPGIAYLTNVDTTHNTGRLDYRNLELGFTATVSDGVSDFVGSSDSLIYAVPFGKSAGIWAVRAR